MNVLDLDAYVGRSRALDLDDLDWAAIPRHPLSDAAVRTLRYMQDIESHTIVYERELARTRAIDEPEVATFLACWLYEETFHGRAIRRFLDRAGHSTPSEAGPGLVRAAPRVGGDGARRRAWPDFVAVHMTWGAINELTTLAGYQRLAAVERHPVLSDLLERIVRDEARHFAFYYKHAERRLARPGARGRAPSRRSLLGSGRERRCPRGGDALRRRPSLRRCRRPCRRATHRHDDPSPSGLRGRRAGRAVDRAARHGRALARAVSRRRVAAWRSCSVRRPSAGGHAFPGSTAVTPSRSATTTTRRGWSGAPSAS